jgi:hypothetical protein
MEGAGGLSLAGEGDIFWRYGEEMSVRVDLRTM